MIEYSLTDVIDSLSPQIAVIALNGHILHVNKAWKRFAAENGVKDPDAYVGMNYLDICEGAALSGDPYAIKARDSLRSVISGVTLHQVIVYPCHSAAQERWFELRLDRSPVDEGGEFIVAMHLDVTDRVFAERAEAQIKLELDQALERERKLASTDPLTGIGNRRRFFELAEHSMAEATRYIMPMTVMLFDIDHFKKINDAHGHIVGDECLQRVAISARSEFRQADILGRYGGDEFIALMPRTGAEDAMRIAERIIERVRTESLKKSPSNLQISLSMGLASFPNDARDLETLIDCADRALYRAKQAGRGRAISYIR